MASLVTNPKQMSNYPNMKPPKIPNMHPLISKKEVQMAVNSIQCARYEN
jgi:hypothetical protein